MKKSKAQWVAQRLFREGQKWWGRPVRYCGFAKAGFNSHTVWHVLHLGPRGGLSKPELMSSATSGSIILHLRCGEILRTLVWTNRWPSFNYEVIMPFHETRAYEYPLSPWEFSVAERLASLLWYLEFCDAGEVVYLQTLKSDLMHQLKNEILNPKKGR